MLALTGSPAHQLLEIKIDASIEAAQEAFHKVARSFHPDIHRSALTPDELETVTIAYSRVAGAYQDFRSQRMQTSRMRPIKDAPSSPIPGITPPPAAAPSRTPPTGTAVATPNQGTGSAAAMNSKALIYYRKAEGALRRGDLKGALLQMKMAIAGDPQSALLRSALVEIEAELAKK
jgi:hypothetical protein